MAEVILQAVRKVYPNGVCAVRELSLEVQPGELFVLLGPSGCGKTTTLRLIAGLETPTSGQVLIGGDNVTRRPPHQRDVAMLFQSPALYPHLNVRDNLAFSYRLRYNQLRRWFRRNDPPELQQRLKEAVELLRLEALLDRRPAELSGGERQRVALGRALVRRPAVFLLDEPLAHVDAPQRLRLRQDLKLLQRRLAATMIYVTHDQAEALALGDRIGILHQGVLQQVGMPAEVYHKPANRFVAGFVGYPPLNLLPGRLVDRDGVWCFETGGTSLPVPGNERSIPAALANRPMTVGIRPEDVSIGSQEMQTGNLTLTINLIENLGGETWVTLADEKLRLMGKLAGSHEVKIGDRCAVNFNWQRIHWFDEVSGARLAGPGG